MLENCNNRTIHISTIVMITQAIYINFEKRLSSVALGNGHHVVEEIDASPCHVVFK